MELIFVTCASLSYKTIRSSGSWPITSILKQSGYYPLPAFFPDDGLDFDLLPSRVEHSSSGERLTCPSFRYSKFVYKGQKIKQKKNIANGNRYYCFIFLGNSLKRIRFFLLNSAPKVLHLLCKKRSHFKNIFLNFKLLKNMLPVKKEHLQVN